jgi:solute:Na+ symporter, SSS family
MTSWIGLSLGLYAVVMIGLGLFARTKVQTEEDYLVAGRRLPLWLAWGTLLATWFGAATVLGSSEAARDEGMRGTILDPFASGVALIVAGLFFAKPLWEMKLLTTGDLFARAFGRRTELVSSAVQAAGYLPWIAAQYVALGTVLHHYFGLPTEAGYVLAALFVMGLTMTGGMWSVTLTDTLQIVLVLVSLMVLSWVMFSHFGDGSPREGLQHAWETTPPEHRTLLPELGMVASLAWAATWFNGVGGNIPGQDLMQRVFASRDSQTAARACLLAGGVYLLFGMMPVMLGLGSRILLPDHGAQGILLALADALLSTPLTCLFVVALVSIIVSTCTSALLSPSALLAHNLLGRIPGVRSRKLLVDRGAVLAVTGLSLPLAFVGKNVLELLEMAFEVGLVGLLVPFVMGIYGKPRGEWAGLLSILLGLTVWLGHYGLIAWGTHPIIDGFPPEFSGTGASVIGYALGQRLHRQT